MQQETYHIERARPELFLSTRVDTSRASSQEAKPHKPEDVKDSSGQKAVLTAHALRGLL